MDEPVHTPKQRRSRETLDRLLRSTRELLADTPFEDITVQQIVAGAGCSVGNFYQRLANKEALLPLLLDIHYAELRQRVEALVRAGDSDDLAGRVARVVALLITMADEQRGLIRTLVLRHQQGPAAIPASTREAATEIVGLTAAFLLDRRDEIHHPRPERAVEVGLLMVTAAIRERLVLGGPTQAAILAIERDDLGRELAAALLAYLSTPPRR